MQIDLNKVGRLQKLNVCDQVFFPARWASKFQRSGKRCLDQIDQKLIRSYAFMVKQPCNTVRSRSSFQPVD